MSWWEFRGFWGILQRSPMVKGAAKAVVAAVRAASAVSFLEIFIVFSPSDGVDGAYYKGLNWFDK